MALRWDKLILMALLLAIGGVGAGHAETTAQDSDGDGREDRWIHRTGGQVVRVEADTNADGLVDMVQVYENEKILRLERDADHDGRADTWDHFVKGRRVRQERGSPGAVDTVIHFDEKEQVRQVLRDSNGRGRFDQVTDYKDGAPYRGTQDIDGDDQPDVLTTYRDGKPSSRRTSTQCDGRIDQETDYDADGQASQSRHDLDADGHLETVRDFRQGVLVLETRTPAGASQASMRTCFEKGRPVKREEDTNGDGRMDRFTAYDAEGRPREVTLDSRYCGRVDRVVRYADGYPTQDRVDSDGDGRFEQITLFRSGKPYRQEIDPRGSGRPDTIALFDEQGDRREVQSASQGDGRIDTWHYYAGGRLEQMEKRSDGAPQVDLKVHYRDGRPVRLDQDVDRDGHFETRRWYDRPDWSTVLEVRDREDRLMRRAFYKDDRLMVQEWDEERKGRITVREHFDDQGRLVRSEEEHDDAGRLNFVFYYGSDGQLLKAEEDRHGKGVTVRYAYRDGKVEHIEEDCNGDGKADLWEEYDRSETLVKRTRDLDYDGHPDVTDRDETKRKEHSS